MTTTTYNNNDAKSKNDDAYKLKSYGAISITMPSPNSTDLPTWRANENDHHPLLHNTSVESSDSNDSPKYNNNNGNSGKHNKYCGWYYSLDKQRKLFLVILASASIILVAALYKKQHYMPASPVWEGVNKGPLSTLHPVHDLGVPDYTRPISSMPSDVMTGGAEFQKNGPFPTNAWYQGLLLTQSDGPGPVHRAYSVPYIVDFIGPIPGIQVYYGHIDVTRSIVQLDVEQQFGLTIGAGGDLRQDKPRNDPSRKFSIGKMTSLSVEVDWDTLGMSAPVVKGMPYTTMKFDKWSEKDSHGEYVLPTIASNIDVRDHVIKVDSSTKVTCNTNTSEAFLVQRDVEMLFDQSDFTWLAFFSEPVYLQCRVDDEGGFKLQVITSAADHHDEYRPLYVRAAMYKVCSSGHNPIYCHPESMNPNALIVGQGEYGDILRNHSYTIPGYNPVMKYGYDEDTIALKYDFDWDVIDSRVPGPKYTGKDDVEAYHDLIMFALPHHFDVLQNYQTPTGRLYCATGLLGDACLVRGAKWDMREETPVLGLRAPRPPSAWSFPMIEKALKDDINYRVPYMYEVGAGDTYFSGKMLTKQARILAVLEEIYEICDAVKGSEDYDKSEVVNTYSYACAHIELPSKHEYEASIEALKGAVEIWINGSAITTFVYDNSWGGLVSCGCNFDGKTCSNRYPDCPAFGDPGLNFGNAYYNDMHFHYGYHIYAAAAVAHFDPAWGRKYFEQVMLYIRNIANPDESDKFFTQWRHKDWYQGNSWASGITTPPVLNGRNQESSSEAISAYEGIAVYGAEMVKAWTQVKSPKAAIAKQIEEIGLLMTATEVRAANKYWHIHKSDPIKILPTSYAPHVVGIMWQTMAQFQTWFGNAPYLAIGIQFLPLTPVSESRDKVEWSKEVYHEFAQSCAESFDCTNNGWSILEIALQATVGHPRLASGRAIDLPETAFTSAGGNGQSMTNLIWYIASRPMIAEPLPLSREEYRPRKNTTDHIIDCGNPNKCTEYALDTIASDYSCRQRIRYLMSGPGKSEMEACFQVAVYDHPDECGACDPREPYDNVADDSEISRKQCPPCTDKQCRAHANWCPVYENTFVCTEGNSEGGCSSLPWTLSQAVCTQCCELTDCPKLSEAALKMLGPVKVEVDESQCPPCDDTTCARGHRTCPLSGLAPYLCSAGPNNNGCASKPWAINELCESCCKVPDHCD